MYTPSGFQSMYPRACCRRAAAIWSVTSISPYGCASEKSWSHGISVVRALHLPAEVEERVGDRPARVRVGILDPVLARTRSATGRPSGRSRRGSAATRLRHLADPEVVGGREPEDVGRDAHAERVQRRRRVAQEPRDRRPLRLGPRVPVDDLRDVAVAREAHVVELDLVEAGLGGGDADPDRVAPDPPVVRVHPAEAAVVQPARAVRAEHGERGPGGRELGSSKTTTRPIRYMPAACTRWRRPTRRRSTGRAAPISRASGGQLAARRTRPARSRP